MDSRERLMASINHERPDRIPTDLWAEPGVWERLRKDMSLPSDEAVRQALSIDVRYISPVYPPDTLIHGIRQNMWGERWETMVTCFGREWEHTRSVLYDAKSIEDINAFPWPRCDQVDYSGIAAEVKSLEGHAIFYGRIDVFWALTDLGTQETLFMGRDTMERFIFAPLRKIADIVHREGVKLMYHSCGAVREVIPDLIACGVDILNPLQPAARGMAPEGLKRDFGKSIAFHGGIDIQFLLPLKSPREVAAETERVAGILGSGGGWVLAPSHNIQLDTPTPNILAMYRREARRLTG